MSQIEAKKKIDLYYRMPKRQAMNNLLIKNGWSERIFSKQKNCLSKGRMLIGKGNVYESATTSSGEKSDRTLFQA